MNLNLSKYWTEASALVGIAITLLTALGGLPFIPASVDGYVAAAVGALTWVAVNVFHRQAVTAAKAESPK